MPTLRHLPESTRAKISQALKGRKLTEEHKLKLSQSRKGHKQTPEHTANHAAAVTQFLISEPTLRALYLDQKMSLKEIAASFGCGPVTVYRRLKKYGIPIRSSADSLHLRGTWKGWFQKGQKAWNEGKHPSPESVEKVRQKLLGRTTWNKGLHFTEYVSPEVRERRKIQISKTSKRRWADPDYSDRVRRKILASLCATPNNAEETLWKLLRVLGLKYEFVGDGSVIIGGLSPDFINTDGKKAIIELFGEPWHSHQEIPRRKAIYWKFGFRTLIIWSKELEDIQTLAAKLIEFDLKVSRVVEQPAQASSQAELIRAKKEVM